MMNANRRHILLVEDESDDIVLFQRTLRGLNLAKPVAMARSGEDAIAYLRGDGSFSNRTEHPLPALIFLDLKLPRISGFEVLTWIRQQPRLRRVFVVVLTGSHLTIDVYRAYELGANSYLVKPVQLKALAELGKSLHLSWLAGTTPAPAPGPMTPGA